MTCRSSTVAAGVYQTASPSLGDLWARRPRCSNGTPGHTSPNSFDGDRDGGSSCQLGTLRGQHHKSNDRVQPAARSARPVGSLSTGGTCRRFFSRRTLGNWRGRAVRPVVHKLLWTPGGGRRCPKRRPGGSWAYISGVWPGKTGARDTWGGFATIRVGGVCILMVLGCPRRLAQSDPGCCAELL